MLVFIAETVAILGITLLVLTVWEKILEIMFPE